MNVRNIEPSWHGLEKQGILHPGNVYWNLSTPALYEEAIRRREAHLAHLGPLVVRTGQHTGRSPNDKFIVREPSVGRPDLVGRGQPAARAGARSTRSSSACSPTCRARTSSCRTAVAGADPAYRMPIRVITENAWHSLFARNMFIQAGAGRAGGARPAVHVIDAPGLPRHPGGRRHAAPRSSSWSTSGSGWS